MGQILHGCAKVDLRQLESLFHYSKESLIKLANKYSINPKTVAKWRKRKFAHDVAMGPKDPLILRF